MATGESFVGSAFGAVGTACGEVVFNTSMTGYQEITTDPSYQGQLVCMTAPHIGVVGANERDDESGKPQVAALIVRSLSPTHSNWRASEDLDSYLGRHNVVGISDVDTRTLTQLIRDKGAVNGCVTTGDDTDKALSMARDCRPMAGNPLGASAGQGREYDWHEGNWDLGKDDFAGQNEKGPTVALLDCGAKRAIMRQLTSHGLEVRVIPYGTSAASITGIFAGLVVSNGPGDPQPLDEAAATVKELLDIGLPLMGICLGHQILALAAGAQIVKMDFGHHGANHPVQELASGKVMISSQNHGFAVSADSLPSTLEATHVSLFDGSLQGLRHREKPAFGFQGHPEASPGPHELSGLFGEFERLVREHAKTG